MSTLKITVKGQVTIRPDVLRHLGVRPGETVSVKKLPGARVELRAARGKPSISAVFNLFKSTDRPRLSIEEINEFSAGGRGLRRRRHGP